MNSPRGVSKKATHHGSHRCATHDNWRPRHSLQDDRVVMRNGKAVRVGDKGETPLRPGDVAVFAAGSNEPMHDECHYPDIDTHPGPVGFTAKAARPVRTAHLNCAPEQRA